MTDESTLGPDGKFRPVRTLADLESLDFEQILDGYQSADAGDPEPGPNRGRSFWHGWRNRMIDRGEIPMDDDAYVLAAQVVADNAKKRAGNVDR